MTHSQIKHAVSLSLMWSMATELRKNYKGFTNPFKTIMCASSIKAVVDITLRECQKVHYMMDAVEGIKVSTWKDLAQKHYDFEEDVEVSIPTIIEEIFYANYEWMSKIKNLKYNIELIALNLIDDTANPKETRIAVDRYDDILSGHIYHFLKEQKESA